LLALLCASAYQDHEGIPIPAKIDAVSWSKIDPAFEFTLTFYRIFDTIPASLPGFFFCILYAHSQVAIDRLHSSGQFK
jgi:hypothetical protein